MTSSPGYAWVRFPTVPAILSTPKQLCHCSLVPWWKTAFLRGPRDYYNGLRPASASGWYQLRYLMLKDRLCESCVRCSDLKFVSTGQHDCSIYQDNALSSLTDQMRPQDLKVKFTNNEPWDRRKFTSLLTPSIHCSVPVSESSIPSEHF